MSETIRVRDLFRGRSVYVAVSSVALLVISAYGGGRAFAAGDVAAVVFSVVLILAGLLGLKYAQDLTLREEVSA